jgi:hypothetical protein
MALTLSLGALVVLLATACAGVPTGQSNLYSPTLFGTVTDSFSLTSVELLPAPAVNEMRGMSLSHSAAALTSQQLYDLFSSRAGGCDRHDTTYQEDLGLSNDASNSN